MLGYCWDNDCHDGGVVVVDVASGVAIEEHLPPGEDEAFNLFAMAITSGEYVIAGGRTDGSVLIEASYGPQGVREAHASPVRSVTSGHKPDGTLVFASTGSGEGQKPGGSDRNVYWIYEPSLEIDEDEDHNAFTMFRQGDQTSSVVLGSAANSRLVLAGSDDGNLLLWDVETEAPVTARLIGQAGPIHSLAFGTSRDNRLLLATGLEDGTVQLWDPLAPRPLELIATGHASPVVSVALAPHEEGYLA